MRQSIGHRGRRIGYLEAAGGSAPDRALILLHAFPLSADMWRPQLAAVPPGWRFIAPDLRGFGESAPGGGLDTPSSIEDYGEDVLALLDGLALGPVVVAGLSMGGYAAFSLLRLQPDRVAALVLADTRAEADGDAARASRDAMRETLAAGGAAGVFDTMRVGLLGETTRTSRPDVAERVRAIAVAQPAIGIRDALHRLKSRPDSTPLLGAIACPVLIVVGEEDQITTPDVARSLHARIAGSSLALIPKAGHLSNLEQPGEFNAALTRFLQRVDSRWSVTRHASH